MERRRRVGARLPAIRKYFASFTQITDLTPGLLAGMTSLEEITFDSCARLTDEGIARLAALPRLRHLRRSGMPRVSRLVVGAFGNDTDVSWRA